MQLSRLAKHLPAVALPVLCGPGPATPQPQDREPGEPRPFVLLERVLPGSDLEVLEGTYDVWEDRETRTGRVIGLHLIVLPAHGQEPEPDPVVILAGGPGMGATTLAESLADHWALARRDIVLVDQRGTGLSNPLTCDLPPGPGNLQGYLEPMLDEPALRACLAELRLRADLTKYTTPIAMDDLAEVLDALGYGRVNLFGGSYGTRAALVFMRRHPERVRTATLTGVAPLAFRNPLHHARSAQRGIEELIGACAEDPDCDAAYPELPGELETVLERLAREPARVPVRRAESGEELELVLSHEAFGEALRVMMYTAGTAVHVPDLVHRAWQGDYRPFVRQAIVTNRSLRELVAVGMLLCVTCAEDVARIDPDEVESATDGTFLGDARIRDQLQACSFWPRGEVPEGYPEPVRCEAPTLLLSGRLDPVTPPEWGEQAARHLPNSLHLVLPGWHGVGGPCVDSITRSFLASASVEELDTSCVDGMRLPPFVVPRAAGR